MKALEKVRDFIFTAKMEKIITKLVISSKYDREAGGWGRSPQENFEEFDMIFNDF